LSSREFGLSRSNLLPHEFLCCFCSFQRPNCANLRAKCAQFAALKRVISFVFKYFLASFPRFLYILAPFRYSHLTDKFEPWRIPQSLTQARTRGVQESSICVFNARISRSMAVRFEFVSKCDHLFSITYWLRSYYFCIYSKLLLPHATGPSRLPTRPARYRPQPTTMCPIK